MNYERHYNAIINRAKIRNHNGYSEKHHIIPRCLGGDDRKSNLVDLTPEEHYVAHLLLCKMFPDNEGLVFAAVKMTFSSNTQKRNNKLYGWLKRKHSEFSKTKIGPKNSQFGSFWVTDGFNNKKLRNNAHIPENWHKGRTTNPPILNKSLEICSECKIRIQDLYWWIKYKESNISVSEFVRKIYPYNRASFYKMKQRLSGSSNLGLHLTVDQA